MNTMASGFFSSDAQVQAATITGVFAVIVSILSILFARHQTRPKTPKTDPDEVHHKSRSILDAYSGEQNEFIRMVIKDSKDLHSKLDKLDEVVSKMRKERSQFIGAVGRYITKLAAAWGSGGKMPYPDEADMNLLEETLPVDWRRRTK